MRASGGRSSSRSTRPSRRSFTRWTKQPPSLQLLQWQKRPVLGTPRHPTRLVTRCLMRTRERLRPTLAQTVAAMRSAQLTPRAAKRRQQSGGGSSGPCTSAGRRSAWSWIGPRRRYEILTSSLAETPRSMVTLTCSIVRIQWLPRRRGWVFWQLKPLLGSQQED